MFEINAHLLNNNQMKTNFTMTSADKLQSRKLLKKMGGGILFFLLMTNFLFGQSRACITPTPPPFQANYNGWSYEFKRGLYVDCANEIIQDMANGNFMSEANLQN